MAPCDNGGRGEAPDAARSAARMDPGGGDAAEARRAAI